MSLRTLLTPFVSAHLLSRERLLRLRERAEARRLLTWFERKFEFEASGYILHEKIEKRLLGLGAPDIPNLRQGREGLKKHLFVFDELLQGREWLAGKRLSLADFVAAAHLSIIDYFGDMPWREFPACKTWYMKLKSRPCFRPLLNDRWPGLQPAMLGFDACRFTDIDESWPAARRLSEFVEADRHGEMAWIADTKERRKHPRAMWSGARSAILLGVNYGPDHDPLDILTRPAIGAISVYARGDDYHEVIKSRLKTLARWLVATFGGELKVFVDTAPLLEKPLAERAGRVLSRDALMDVLKGEKLEAFDRSVDVHISRIRAAIEDDPKKPRRILTLRGTGYVFARDQDR
eukprot:gene42733-56802_t